MVFCLFTVSGTGSLPGGPAQLAPTNRGSFGYLCVFPGFLVPKEPLIVSGKKRIIYHPSADFWWGPKYFLVVPYLFFDDPLSV